MYNYKECIIGFVVDINYRNVSLTGSCNTVSLNFLFCILSYLRGSTVSLLEMR